MASADEGKRLDQLNNPDNSLSHYLTTSPEIWQRSAGQLTQFVFSMGTTSIISGSGRFLMQKKPAIQVVNYQPATGYQIPGIRRWSARYQPTIYEPQWVDQEVTMEY